MIRFIIISLIIAFCQVYFYNCTKNLLPVNSPIVKKLYLIVYLLYNIIILSILYFRTSLTPFVQKYIASIIFLIIISQIISCIFFLIDDLRFIIEYVFKKIILNNKSTNQNNIIIKRSTFIKWIGVFLGGGFIATLIYGLSNKYNYKLVKKRIIINGLPNALKGIKIIQISDIHSGSFDNEKAVEKGILKILEQKPDLIVFTGDLVNNISTEFIPYKQIFSKLKAPLGVYSILGNHDYGDYAQWKSLKEKEINLDNLKNHHKDIGWNLLLNENKILEFNGEKIALIGVENWPAKNFIKYGDLEKAYTGTDNIKTKILLSHDPSHWDAEITKKYKDIQLTLSGHTHGMQFGIENKWIQWSPVKYIYKQWAGLYKKDNQQIYVNRGYGFLGYQGRVGILPEITLIELI